MSNKHKGSNTRRRLTANWFGVFVVLYLVGGLSLPASAQNKLDKAGIEVRKLTEDLMQAKKAHRVVGTGDVQRRANEIESLVNAGIIGMLDQNPRLSSQQLEEKLRHVLGIWEPKPEFASAFSCRTQGHSIYIVAYDISYGELSQKSFVGVFSNERGRYALKAAVENPLPMQTAAVALVGRATGSVIRFLAYGINWGDAHNRLTVIAYEFNGHQLKPIWSRFDLPEGEVKVNGEEIVLTFYTRLVPLRDEPVPQRSEVYRVMPKGIELIKTTEKLLR